jgi:hypothetical protein
MPTMNRQHDMDCVDFKVLLSPYIDGELGADARFAADRHLIECRSCRELLERAEANDAAIRLACEREPQLVESALATASLPDGFERAVLDRAGLRRTLAWRRTRGSLALLATAAALALAGALWVIWPTQQGEGREADGRSLIARDANGWGGSEGLEQLDPSLHGPPKALRVRDLGRSVPTLSADEAQCLHSAALLLESIVATPFENVAARGRLRDMAIYDELTARLAAIQHRFDTIDRRFIAACQAVLLELQREHLDLTAWNALQDDLRSFELARQLEILATSSDGRQGA